MTTAMMTRSSAMGAIALPLAGRKGLVTGIANEQSIAWGCARAFRRLGADLAITYLNDKARPHVQPLASEVEAKVLAPLDLRAEGQIEAVFDRIEREWGRLDFVLHSIAFAPKDDLHGRVVDCSRAGFLRHGHLVLVVHPDGEARGAADGRRRRAVHHDLLRLADGRAELQHDGAGQGSTGGCDALSRGGAGAEGHPGARDLAGPAQDARGVGHRHSTRCWSRRRPRPRRAASSRIDDVGMAVAYLATDAAKLITGETLYIDGGYHIID